MGIVFRQSIKTTMVIFVGVGLGAALTYLTTVIIPIKELGGTRIIQAQGSVLQLLLLMGTGSLVQTFSQRYDENDPRKPVLISLALITPVLTALLFCIPYFFFRDFVISRYQPADRPFLSQFYTLIPILGIFLSYIAQLEHYLTSQYKVAASVFMREVVLRACLLLLLAVFYFGWISFENYVVCIVVLHIIPITCLLLLASKTDGFYFNTNWKVFTKKDYREIIHYSWYHMLTGASLTLLSFLDVLLLGPLSSSGLADVAIYTNAQFFIAIMIVPYRAMAGAAFPKLNEAWLKKDKALLHDLFSRTGINMLVVAFAMWLIVCCNLHNAVSIFPPDYASLLPVVLILSIGRLVDMSTGLNTELISVSNFYKFNFRMAIVLLVAVVIMDRIFIPKFGIFGAAWVASLSLVMFNISKMIFLYQKTGLQPFSKKSLTILAAGVIAYGANVLMPFLTNPFLDTLLRTVIVIFTYCIPLYFFRASPDLTSYIQQVRTTKRLF